MRALVVPVVTFVLGAALASFPYSTPRLPAPQPALLYTTVQLTYVYTNAEHEKRMAQCNARLHDAEYSAESYRTALRQAFYVRPSSMYSRRGRDIQAYVITPRPRQYFLFTDYMPQGGHADARWIVEAINGGDSVSLSETPFSDWH